MNQRQKNKFHKAIKDLIELLDELNQGIYGYELIYNQATCTFKIIKMVEDAREVIVEQDDTYFPDMSMEE